MSRVSVFTDTVNAMLVDKLSAEWMVAGCMLVREDTISELSANGSDNCPLLVWEDSPACEIYVVRCSGVYVRDAR